MVGCASVLTARRDPFSDGSMNLVFAAVDVFLGIGCLAAADGPARTVGAVWFLLAAFNVWVWWHRRRGKKKRTFRDLGYKARAILQSLTRQARRGYS